ncbi:MAG: hypothetical protein JGK01_09755 [Microcoleus sp. PH2017_03_ELD_O_A]|nr:hypothetical protein [Microcoleus sp. PH2017_03_ELD_O_A]
MQSGFGGAYRRRRELLVRDGLSISVLMAATRCANSAVVMRSPGSLWW